MKYITLIIFLISFYTGSCQIDCRTDYEFFTTKPLINNSEMQYSPNKLIADYNKIADCTIDKKSRNYIKKMLNGYKQVNKLVCEFNDGAEPNIVLRKLEALTPSEDDKLYLTFVNARNLVSGKASNLRSYCNLQRN